MKQKTLFIFGFALIGPLIGIAMALLLRPEGQLALALSTYVGLPMYVVIGYIYGLPAALLSGIAAAVLLVPSFTVQRFSALMLLSAAFAFANVYLLGGDAYLACQAAGYGAVSSAICALLFVRPKRNA